MAAVSLSSECQCGGPNRCGNTTSHCLDKGGGADLAEKTRPSKNNGVIRCKLCDPFSCKDYRTLLHTHARACMCGAPFDLRAAPPVPPLH